MSDDADLLRDAGADPLAPLDELVAGLRRAGRRGPNAELRRAAAAYRAAGAGLPLELDPAVHVGRAEAAEILGVGVKRVDQLGQRGALDRVRAARGPRGYLRSSVEREARDRGRGVAGVEGG